MAIMYMIKGNSSRKPNKKSCLLSIVTSHFNEIQFNGCLDQLYFKSSVKFQ